MLLTQVRRTAIACGVALLAASAARAQVSGLPGDGIPDFYYFPTGGLIVETSFGPVTGPAGTMFMDTDGFDVNAVLIAGPDVSVPLVTLAGGGVGCYLCEGMNLPQTTTTASGTYTVGYGGTVPNGSTQWIRTSPLQGSGFIGVVGTGFVDGNGTLQPWPVDFPPFLDFPEPGSGLANYGPGLVGADFPQIFEDDFGTRWSVRVASGATGDSLYTNVAYIPEPVGGLFTALGLAALSLLRRGPWIATR